MKKISFELIEDLKVITSPLFKIKFDFTALLLTKICLLLIF